MAHPVYPGYFADPFVWQHEGVWYAIGTGEMEAHSEADPAGVFLLLRSDDFVTWKPVGPALRKLPPDFGDTYWAPEVAFHEGTFYLYYSVGRGDKSHHIRVAASTRPEGPYLDMGVKVTDPFVCPFAIDASPFRDRDGQWYLAYARDFLDTEQGFRAGTGIVIDHLIDMTRLAGEERVIARARFDWQRFLKDRIMYGGIYDWHTVEGPFLWLHEGRYYCFYSAGRWENESYGVDYAVADHPFGIFRNEATGAGARVLRSRPGLIGPGHNSVVKGPAGEDHIVFHAWNSAVTARQMFTAPIIWSPEGPAINLAT